MLPCTATDFPRRGNSGPAADNLGFDSPLPFQTRRSFPRRGKSPSRLDSSSGKRTLEVHAISAKISKGSSPKSNLRATSKQCSKEVHSCSKAASRQTCCPALKLAKSLPPLFFLEIFSGSGRLGQCVLKDNNVPVLLWDIQYGPEYDLRSLKKRQLIAGWMRAGFICGGHLGTPCNSFTRARDNPPGPPPLRSNSHVLGLPNLAVHDQKKVNDGNLFMRFSVFILRLALVLHIPFSMENPRTSRLWLCPAVQKLMRNKNTYQQIVEFCMFGMRWRKSTMFVSVWVRFDNLNQFRCIGAKRGCCKRSGEPHQPLAGKNAAGVWWTKIAEPYPLQLGHKLAQCSYNFAAQQRAEQFELRLKPV